MKILFSLFLIAHGLIHASYISPRPPQKAGAPAWPFDLSKSWLLTTTGLNAQTIKTVGIILVLLVTVGFVLSGLGWLGFPGLKSIWVPVTSVSSILSLILLALFWHNWFVVGPIIDLVLLYLIYYKNLRP